MLSRLVYYSRQNPVRMANSEVIDLVQAARRKNAANGLTGGLLFSGHYFLQVLEGERKTVEALFHDIKADPRHRDVTLIDQSLVEDRLFGDWFMAFCGLEVRHGDTLEAHCGTRTLEPSELRGEQAIALVREILMNNARLAASDASLGSAMGVTVLR